MKSKISRWKWKILFLPFRAFAEIRRQWRFLHLLGLINDSYFMGWIHTGWLLVKNNSIIFCKSQKYSKKIFVIEQILRKSCTSPFQYISQKPLKSNLLFYRVIFDNAVFVFSPTLCPTEKSAIISNHLKNRADPYYIQ